MVGGGGGTICGLRIDHVLHAIVGTPTLNGQSSPSRTIATIRQPLIAFCEVLYADVFAALLDDVAVVRQAWLEADEKVRGIVAQIAAHRRQSYAGRPYILEMVDLMIELCSMLQQCQGDGSATFHIQHKDYSRETKRQLAQEYAVKVQETVWRLSTSLLHMQLDLRDPFTPSQVTPHTPSPAPSRPPWSPPAPHPHNHAHSHPHAHPETSRNWNLSRRLTQVIAGQVIANTIARRYKRKKYARGDQTWAPTEDSKLKPSLSDPHPSLCALTGLYFGRPTVGTYLLICLLRAPHGGDLLT